MRNSVTYVREACGGFRLTMAERRLFGAAPMGRASRRVHATAISGPGSGTGPGKKQVSASIGACQEVPLQQSFIAAPSRGEDDEARTIRPAHGRPLLIASCALLNPLSADKTGSRVQGL